MAPAGQVKVIGLTAIALMLCVAGHALNLCLEEDPRGHVCYDCPIGSQRSSDGKACVACPASCADCVVTGNNSSYCVNCTEGYLLNSDTGECDVCSSACKSCPVAGPGRCDAGHCLTGYTTDKNMRCQACSPNCLTCEIRGPGLCDNGTSCGPGFATDGNLCAPCSSNCPGTCEVNGPGTCDQGQCAPGFIRELNHTCQACAPDCQSCYDEGPGYCDTSGCAPRYAYNYDLKICAGCPANCQRCKYYSDGKTACDECVASFTMESTHTCRYCPDFCARCERDGTSVNCFPDSCHDNYIFFRGTGTCHACVDNCDSCSLTANGTDVENLQTFCLQDSCQPGYALKASDNKCYKCPTHCIDCYEDDERLWLRCGGCEPESTFFPQDYICLACPGGCASCSVNSEGLLLCVNCKTGYSITADQRSCIKCPEMCDMCEWVQDQIRCVDQQCYDDFVLSADLGTCQHCPTNCQYCRDTAEGAVCIFGGCRQGYTQAEDGSCHLCHPCVQCQMDDGVATCLDQTCIDGFSWDAQLSQCTACLKGCVRCMHLNNTSTCLSGQCSSQGYTETPTTACLGCPVGCSECQLEDNIRVVCVAGGCQDGYVYVDNGCARCPANCAKCSYNELLGRIECDTGACVVAFGLNTEGLCAPCGRFCNNCTLSGAGACDVGGCIKSTTLNIRNGNCERCGDRCESCEDAGIGACDTCLAGHIQISGGTCAECGSVTHCLSCRAPSTCEKCQPAYGVLGDESGCGPCPENCAICEAEADELVCSFGGCMAGHIMNSRRKCIACPAGCDTCGLDEGRSYAVCTTPECALGHVRTGDVCGSCPSHCVSCHLKEGRILCDLYACADGTSPDAGSGQCVACAPNCKMCAEQGLGLCDQGHCDTGHVYNNDTMICQECGTGCNFCDSAGPAKCDPGGCQGNYFYDTALQECIACSVPYCLSCPNGSDTSCAQCVSGYTVVNGSTCLACEVGCSTCDQSGAGQCDDGGCPRATFFQVNTCVACPTNCGDCASASTCDQHGCEFGYVYNHINATAPELYCVEDCAVDCGVGACDVAYECHPHSCVAGHGITEVNTCGVCAEGCTSCRDVGAGLCDFESCNSGYNRDPAMQTCRADCTIPYCSICTQSFPNECAASRYCAESTRLHNGQCVACGSSNCLNCDSSANCDICQPGHYLNTIKSCIECSKDGCLHCSESTCQVCLDGFRLDKKDCTACELSRCVNCEGHESQCDLCEPGSSLSANRKQCQVSGGCSAPGCTACIDGVCYHCQDGFHWTGSSCTPCSDTNCMICPSSDDKCVQCMEGYFLNGESCAKCGEFCAACTSLGGCDSCIAGYFYSRIGDRDVCQPCAKGCESCTVVNQCTTCLPGFTLSGVICNVCPMNCKECSGSTCTACTGGFYIPTDPGDGPCEPCSKNCRDCSPSGDCVRCQDGFFLISSADPETIQCLPCGRDCEKCGNQGTGCDTCKKGFFLDQNADLYFQCKPCADDCSYCDVAGQGKCDAEHSITEPGCRPPLIWNHADEACTGVCLTNCQECVRSDKCQVCLANTIPEYDGPEGDRYIVQCKDPAEACAPGCGSCEEAGLTTCKADACLEGYYFREMTGKCEKSYCTSVSPSQVLNLDQQCIDCPSGCAQCALLGDQLYCLQGRCQYGYVWYTNSATLGACEVCPNECGACYYNGSQSLCLRSGCEKGYALLSDGTCAACPPGCALCVASLQPNVETECVALTCYLGHVEIHENNCFACPTGCASCSLNADLSRITCDGGCLSGYAQLTDGTCLRCPPNCTSCVYNSDSGLGLCDADGCVVSSTLDARTGRCVDCPADCDDCSSATSCHISGCSEGFGFSYDTHQCEVCPVGCSQCVDVGDVAMKCASGGCQFGYVPNSDGVCVACSDPACRRCRYLWETDTVGQCMDQQCAENFGIKESDGSCQECPEGCSSCSHYSVTSPCFGCRDGYILSGQNCEACPRNCESCGNDLALETTVCDQGGCLMGHIHIPNDTRSTCAACPNNCLNCTYDTVQDRTRCSPGMCAIGFTLIDFYCKACPTDCENCDATGGESCRGGVCRAGYGFQNIYCAPCAQDCTWCAERGADKCDSAWNCTGATTLDSQYTCRGCDPNCDFCHERGPGLCDGTVGDNYCRDRHLLNTLDHKCYACPAHCISCAWNGNQTRTLCNPDMCEPGYGIVNADSTCGACEGLCERCEDNGMSYLSCKECPRDYYLNRAGCISCPAGCLNCEVNNGRMICHSCESRMTVNRFKSGCVECPSNCDTCVDKVEGRLCVKCSAYYTLDGGLCVACPEHCLTCDFALMRNQRPCTSCADGYGINADDVCVGCAELLFSNCGKCRSVAGVPECEECMFGYTLSPDGPSCRSCSDGLTNCPSSCTWEPAVCSACQPGYHLTADHSSCGLECHQCEGANCTDMISTGQTDRTVCPSEPSHGCWATYRLTTDRKQDFLYGCLNEPRNCSSYSSSACERDANGGGTMCRLCCGSDMCNDQPAELSAATRTGSETTGAMVILMASILDLF